MDTRTEIVRLQARIAELERQIAELRPTPRDSYMMWVRRVNERKFEGHDELVSTSKELDHVS